MSDSVIEVSGLSRRFGSTQALDEVSLNMEPGVVLGLVGENGAGKTTLIKHLLGLLKARAGSVRVFGVDPVTDPKSVLRQIGYLSETRDLPEWMRVGELMRYTQAFYPNWDHDFAEELRVTFELDINQRVKSLSRGQRARAGLLAALAHRPQLLVLDEPSSGLDPIVRRDILSAIIRTVADEGRNVLFSSHLLDEVERVADTVAMLHRGKLLMHDPLDLILERHHRLTVRLADDPATTPHFAGAIFSQGNGRNWTLICNGQLEQLRQSVAEQGGTIVDETAPSLDDIFVATVKQP